MQRQPVSSSNLYSVGYDPDAATLEVEFQDGSIYRYPSVPERVYEELKNAGSHGQYFHQHITDVYSYAKIA